MATTAQPTSSAAAAEPSAAAPPSSMASAAPASSAAADAPPSSMASSAAESVASSAATGNAPEKYDLKLPANVKNVDPALMQRIEATARSRGLSNEDGQHLLDAVVTEMQAADAARIAAWEPGKGTEWNKRDAEWRAQALADAEIGGSEDKLKTSLELAQKVMRKFGGEEATKFLEDTGLGSHPATIRLLSAIGRAMSESSLILGTPSLAEKPATIAERMYGKDGTGKPKTE